MTEVERIQTTYLPSYLHCMHAFLHANMRAHIPTYAHVRMYICTYIHVM